MEGHIEAYEFASFRPKCNFSPSETWILPIVTLHVMVAYAVVAIGFYNRDG